ncbi:MAG TPA: CAP domain-containing protein [Demequinaceae bacterium]
MSSARLRTAVAMIAATTVLSACGGLAPAATATPATPSTATPSTATQSPATLPDAATFARALFDGTNATRSDAGIPQLVWSECAAELALPRALHTLPEGILSHEPLLPSCEDFTYLGENLARANYTPAQVMAAWLDSPGHRANLLDPDFTEVGIGCVPYEASSPSVPASGSSDAGGMACSEVFLGYVP